MHLISVTTWRMNDYRGKRIIVTGGLGFIGSNLAIRLVEAGASVTIIDSRVPGCGANLFNIAPIVPGIDLIESCIGDVERFASALKEADAIFNLAGEISHSRSMDDPERDLYLNTVTQLRFLLACRANCPGARILYASTRQIYGKPVYLPVDEQHPVQPIDFNGVHKCAATQYHLLLARRGDLDCRVLRLSNVYGPRMALHLPQQGFLGVYVARALNGEPIVVYGDGEQLRDPVHVDDVVEVFLRAGLAPDLKSRVFNVGGPQPVTLNEIAAAAARQSGRSPIHHLPFPEHLIRMDIGSYFSDLTRTQRELGWVPSIEFEAGLKGTLAYYREHRDRYFGFTKQPELPTAARLEYPAVTQ
ncbi:MAG: NAD-dependent epimerase/dehydratase family protein [Bryobacterales bacterium]|nr:NAD-dependent epimerase/dehydratase family protein [Bryobacterales bacterium]